MDDILKNGCERVSRAEEPITARQSRDQVWKYGLCKLVLVAAFLWTVVFSIVVDQSDRLEPASAA